MPTLERAIALAAAAHAGQTDRAGQPYILHPLRVMLEMRTGEERIVAVLHDVVEKTDVTLADLAEQGFDGRVIDAVDAMTRRSGEPYMRFVDRAVREGCRSWVGAWLRNGVAKNVKIADLRDNMEINRSRTMTEEDETRRRPQERYRQALSRVPGGET